MKKASIRMLVLSMIISLLAFPTASFAEKAESASLSLSSNRAEVGIRQEVQVQVHAEHSSELYGAEFYVSYDPAILSYVSVQNGADYSVFLSSAATESGKLYISAIRNGSQGKSSSQVAKITFKGVKVEDATQLQLTVVKGIKQESSLVEVDGKFYSSMKDHSLTGNDQLGIKVVSSGSNDNATDPNDDNNSSDGGTTPSTPTPAPVEMTDPKEALPVQYNEQSNSKLVAISAQAVVKGSSSTSTTLYAYEASLGDDQVLMTNWSIPTNADSELVGLYFYNEETKKWEYVREAERTATGLSVNLEKSGKYALMQYNAQFIDTNTLYNEAKRAIEVLAARHIVEGVSDESFAPDKTLTRAEWTAMLVRAFGWTKDAGAADLMFTDVPSNAWYKEALEIAYSRGLITGYQDDTFRANQAISRAELAVLIARIANNNTELQSSSQFADADQVPAFAASAVQYLKDSGLVKGYNDETFRPLQSSSRAEAAILLVRILQQ